VQKEKPVHDVTLAYKTSPPSPVVEEIAHKPLTGVGVAAPVPLQFELV
tara:strand:+ start:464 stop:607 length:144 start_codon:yes stop_codon:yes gene_type:complete